jgi:hypothetical protein
MKEKRYTTQLQAGLGMVEETRVLLDLWQPGATKTELYNAALEAGCFPGISARRLQNLIFECFAPRLLTDNGKPASYLKALLPSLGLRDFEQLLLIYTCRSNDILLDFISEIYWTAYASGRDVISNNDSYAFVEKANQRGITVKPWAESTIRRVASYLTGACADFGLLEGGTRSLRKILPARLEWRTAVALVYDLHFSGIGDNMIVSDIAWTLFGMNREDVITELKRLSLKCFFIIQTVGDVIRIGWQCKNIEELAHALVEV